ncbi:MAG: hypothetical protein V7636_1564, partial [Actinomycetota bacterium]
MSEAGDAASEAIRLAADAVAALRSRPVEPLERAIEAIMASRGRV